MQRWLLAALLCAAVPAQAIPIQLDFIGRVEDPRSEYFQQPVEASFTFDQVLSFGYQVDPTHDDCISGVDATLSISSAHVALNGEHIDASPSTAVFRADSMCSGAYSFAAIYDGGDRVGGFQIDLQGASLSEMLSAENPFATFFQPSSGGSTFWFLPFSEAGGYSLVAQVPEPSTLVIFALGLLGISLAHRNRAQILARIV